LAGFGEAVGFFPVANRPRFIKPVDKSTTFKGRSPFLEISPHAEIAVGSSKHGFGLSQELGSELLLYHLPFINRIDVCGGSKAFTVEHNLLTSQGTQPLSQSDSGRRRNLE
jgi:hypothetical protein